MITKIDTLTFDQKEKEREKIAQDIKKYLAEGGKVTQCSPRAFTQVKGVKKKFSSEQFGSAPGSTSREFLKEKG